MTLQRRFRVTATLGLAAALVASSAFARDLRNDGVASANPRFDLVGQATGMAPGFDLRLLARGVAKLENRSRRSR